MRMAFAAVLAGSMAWGSALAGEARFTAKPAVARTGERVTITFAVSEPTDVAVAIEDAKGKVVRHLVAGLLGKNPPLPLKANALGQSIEWDGKDDLGQPAAGGPFTVRVALGMRPVYDRTMFREPGRLLSLNGLATGPTGDLYTRSSGRDGGMGPAVDIRVFSPEGKYVRTIAPLPAGLDEERVAAVGAFQVGKGEYVPRVYDLREYNFYPVSLGGPRLTQMAVSTEGYCFFLSEGNYASACVLDSQGGVPKGWSFAGKGLAAKGTRLAGGFLAMSSDGKRLYVSGASAGGSAKTTIPAVFWTDVRERGPAQVLCGDRAAAGGGDGQLSDPQGVAVDGKGHLLVADRGNGRVCVFNEADGRFAAAFPVPDADKVAVDPASGAVYVLTMGKKQDLVKFSDWREHKEVCRLALEGGGAGMSPFLAVSSGEKPAVWVGSNGYRRYTLLRIPDLGAAFGEAVEMNAQAGYLVQDVFTDRLRDEVYVNLGDNYWRFKDGADKAEKVPIGVAGNTGLQLRVARNGNIYGLAWADRLFRWDHAGKPLPYESSGTNILRVWSDMTYQMRALFLDQIRDEICLIQPAAQRKTPGCYGAVMRVYDLEGNLKREPITSLSAEASVGPLLDPAGNIYVGEPSRPRSHEIPEFFKDRLPPITKEAGGRLLVPQEVFPYSWGYGSVVKFSPQGGAILWPGVAEHKHYRPWTGEVAGAVPMDFYSQSSGIRIDKAASQGVLWAHVGFFPLTSRVGCNCLASYFDVDYFGRVFYPDAGRSRVVVLDTNGNEVCHFGRYGNRDAEGKDEVIPLAMGLAVAATDRHIYVGDIINQCLVRVRLGYAAEAACTVE